MEGKRNVPICLLLLVSVALLQLTDGKETEVRAHAGTNVTLPCRVDTEQCGILHSVKWYRDTSRIYVFSQAGKVARAEGDATERMTVEYTKSNETLLKISPVEVEDEAIYKCEITYLEVRENCDVVQIVKLTTLVKPASVRVLGNDGVSISNSTKLKAKNEGSEVEVICEAIGGKPIPTITWYNGTTVLKRASYSTHSESGGVGTGVSKLRLTLSRGDLNARFECKVESEALEEPIISWITVDVNVKPTQIELTGVENYIQEGHNVYLVCNVYGARPAATVRWYNGSSPIEDERLIETIPEDARDGTYTTKSSLIFVATRWENGRSFNCYAENEVTKSMLEPALHKLVFLDVRFPPSIKVTAARSVVKERESVMLSCTYYANPQKLLGATWLKDGKNFTRIAGKHKHGDIETPSLHINNISRDDMGEYTCWLRNEIGPKQSEESIYLDVHYPPDVEVIMEPSTPVKALDRGNVTLECNVTSGNPPDLRRVRWSLGGVEMAELPVCNYNQSSNETLGGPFCGIDPSILSLIKVEENFAGNYTCQGENDAGFGPVSEPQELVVYYPPTPAKLRYYPSTVIKKASVTLECTVDHPGRPENVTYIWYRGGHQIHNITVSKWTIQQASLETRSNFTCIALNEGGQSAPATVSINVLAPPAFIGTLNSYKGVLYSSKNVSLTCRIECFPLCSIVWFKDGYPLTTYKNLLYYVNNTVHPADYNKNDFESIESTLIWNMTNWPNQQLNKSAPPSDYTCASRSTHDVGTQVNFTTEIAIDFPPEDLTVSKHLVNVVENEIPDSVKCSGKGRPKLNYVWKRNFTSPSLAKHDILQLDKMPRSAAGSYVCEAYNKYGNQTVKVYFNVQYKPDCSIEITERDGSPALICMATANPQEVTFTWKIRESNDTIDVDSVIKDGLNSYLILDSSVDTYRTYQCIANNSVGASVPCERYVPAYQEQSSQIGEPGAIPWYKRLGRENLIIIIASIVALIICVIIVCIVIIILCRKKRESSKCNNPLEMEEREKPDGQSPDVQDRPRWPLRPGVLVHVNKMHGVNISQLTPGAATPFKTTSVSKGGGVYDKYQCKKSKVYARLRRLTDCLGIRAGDRIPSGITVGASGVVTYKKIKPTTPTSEPSTGSRKRKRSDPAPNPSSAGDKMRLGAAPPVGGSADPANDPDKGFYENLPFHGMQNPPNKPISIIAPFTQGNSHNFTQSAKSLTPSVHKAFPVYNKLVQRHQSFHGFQNNQQNMQMPFYAAGFNVGRNFSNPYLNSYGSNFFVNASNAPLWPTFNQSLSRQQLIQPGYYRFSQPLLNFNPFCQPNPFNVPPQPPPNRVVGRRETDIRRTASGINISKPQAPKDEPTPVITYSTVTPVDQPIKNKDDDKRFGSLEIKKHKCYSPTFYSMRCKKHAKKRPLIYALPKKILADLPSSSTNECDDKKEEVFENLTDSIQISEQDLGESTVPVPAPRCKKARKSEVIYQNISLESKTSDNSCKNDTSNSSNDSSDIVESEISVVEALVHSSKDLEDDGNPTIDSSNLKRHNTFLVSHADSKSPVTPMTSPADHKTSAFTPKLVGASPKAIPNSDNNGATAAKIEALKAIKNSPTLKVSPNFVKPKTESPKGALSLQIQARRKNSCDNLSQSEDSSKENLPLIPQMPLLDPHVKWSPSLGSASQQNAFYTLTTPHYKHLNVGLPPQYSATIPHHQQKHTKLIPRALFNEQLPKSKSFSSKSKHKKHFQIPLQKCHSFKFQTAESYFQPIKNIHEEDLMKNGYVSDYPESSSRSRPHKRDKPKQKTKGPLVLVRRPNDYHENVQFQENVQNSVQLQYPQPIIGRNPHNSNATNKPNGIVYADLDMPKNTNKKGSHEASSTQGKTQKSKAKTEYATLSFNDVGQEIDV